MHSRLGIYARAALWGSVAAICALTFAWPFIVSGRPEQPVFKFAAISTLLVLFLAMLALLVVRSVEQD